MLKPLEGVKRYADGYLHGEQRHAIRETGHHVLVPDRHFGELWLFLPHLVPRREDPMFKSSYGNVDYSR